MAKSKLTPYQQAFVNEYLKCRCKTEAAIKSGYKGERPNQAGYAMFRRPEVRAEIDRRLNTLAEKVNLDLEHILEDLEDIKAKCMHPQAVMINGEPIGTFEFDSRGALKALELQGKLLELFKESRSVDLGKDTLEALIGGSWEKPAASKKEKKKKEKKRG